MLIESYYNDSSFYHIRFEIRWADIEGTRHEGERTMEDRSMLEKMWTDWCSSWKDSNKPEELLGVIIDYVWGLENIVDRRHDLTAIRIVASPAPPSETSRWSRGFHLPDHWGLGSFFVEEINAN